MTRDQLIEHFRLHPEWAATIREIRRAAADMLEADRALLAEVVRADMTPADDDAEVCVYLPVDLWRRLREAVGK